MDSYDFLIAGGGLAGLSLACHLVRSSLSQRSILIVDNALQDRDDRTWAFWSNRPLPFDETVYRSWHHLQFVGADARYLSDLGDYRYQVIRGLDFYRRAKDELSAHKNVHFRRGWVGQIEDGPNRAKVTIDGQVVAAQWVFDSRYKPAGIVSHREGYHDLKLHFLGWEITSTKPAFDPHLATMMDFRTPQQGAARFFYLLPYTEERALVEYTIFSNTPLKPIEYESAIREYLRTVQGIQAYRIERRESGCIPITDRPFPRQLGRRIMAIGTKGGRVKPTTGYAFTRIQDDSAAIVQSLERLGHPFDVPADPWRYRLCDSILLQIMSQHGDQIEPIFRAMFKNNPIGRIFRFLDETASPVEQLQIIPTLPPFPFLRALFQKQVLHNLYRGKSQHGRPIPGYNNP